MIGKGSKERILPITDRAFHSINHYINISREILHRLMTVGWAQLKVQCSIPLESIDVSNIPLFRSLQASGLVIADRKNHSVKLVVYFQRLFQ